MFLKGLLFGIGFIVGTGVVVTCLLGVMVLTDIAQKVAASWMPVEGVSEKRKQVAGSHRAKLSFLVHFPTASEERMELPERKTEFFP